MFFQKSSTKSVRDIALAAKDAATALATTTTDQRNKALRAMASALRVNATKIVAENTQDMDRERAQGMKESLLDRLMLDSARVEAMASALEDLVALPDPVGIIQKQGKLYNGIDLKRISVPLGVVAMVYEARPNVTADAAGICIKTGNAVVLRGGSAALCSNNIIADVLHEAAVGAGMPENCISAIKTTDRKATDELMSLRGIVDVLIPRGGAGLIDRCVELSKVPVIETGIGNCHIYVEASADFDMAREIIMNAKLRRTGVCNAAESLLIDEEIAAHFLPLIMKDLFSRGVIMHGDASTVAIANILGIAGVVEATEEDWEKEYLEAEISLKIVSGVEEAIAHINQYGTKHSDAIITSSESAADRFCAAVDSTSVYVNASTAFTDGGQFGMGAEIGISTQKLHARGPFALEALTSYKYVLRGSGQVRS